jgi:hypothetical protein
MREDTKRIEAKWHPNPVINGLEVCHEHRRDEIIFTAWNGDDPANNRQLKFSRHDVVFGDVPTQADLEWLTGAGE